MNCPMEVHLGVYALGAADAAERRLVEDHLPECDICRTQLARLAPMADLLAKVPEGLVSEGAAVRTTAPAPRTVRTARPARPARTTWPARGWRKAAAAAVTAAAGFAGGLWLMPHDAATAPADVTLSAADPATHVRATAALTGTSWGTSIRLVADGVPSGQLCWLVIHARDGESEIVGYWNAGSGEPVSVPASAAWRPADIASVQVVTKAGVLVTVAADPFRPGGEPPSNSPATVPSTSYSPSSYSHRSG